MISYSLPEIWGKGLDGVFHLVVEQFEQLPARAVRRLIMDVGIGPCLLGRLRAGQLDEGGAARLAPVFVNERIAQDGQEPGLYVSALLELIVESQRFDYGVLGQILRIGGIAGQAQRYRVQHVHVFENKLLEFVRTLLCVVR